MKKKRRLWIPILCVVLVLAIAGSAVAVIRTRNAGTVDVYPVSNVSDTYWGDTTQLDATVTSGKSQIVSMQEGLIQSINVSEGDEVQPGDVLMVYDVTSFQLTLKSDEARIAVLEAKMDSLKRDLSTYQGLKPSESAPKPTKEIIDHGALNMVDRVDIGTASESGASYDFLFNCDSGTVVSAEFLTALRAKGLTAEFRLYEGNTLYGSWVVSGDDASLQPYEVSFDTEVTLPVPVPDTPEEPTEPTEPGEDDGDDEGDPNPAPDTPDVPSEVTGTVTVSTTIDPIHDWNVTDGLSFTGDGVELTTGAGYGQLVTCTPSEYEQYETIYHDNSGPDSKGNYMYSRAELAQMVKDTSAEIVSTDLDLKSAKLTYEKDKLISETGEVTASISGVVTDLKDPATLSNGETLFTVKGNENFTVTAYIGEINLSKIQLGDMLQCNTYESGSSFTATITEIGDTPARSGGYGWGNENPNTSYYPIVATVDDPDVDLIVGEWAETTIDLTGGDGAGFYIQKMYIRSDDQGSYVMKADENDRLTKQYVKTGKTIWGSEIQIKGGLSRDDRIAFPYGKTVREGASVVEKEYPEFW